MHDSSHSELYSRYMGFEALNALHHSETLSLYYGLASLPWQDQFREIGDQRALKHSWRSN